MKRIIKDGRIVADAWRLLPAEGDLGDLAAAGELLLLPLVRWQALAAPQHGVWLAPDDALDALLPALPRIPLIAVHFPSFTDGRGYSLARLLRQRHGFSGELRAIGDVLRDQLYFLQQCGFNAFDLRADQPLDEALVALRDYSWTPLAGR
jgi:uncharacterized protein (DUF934 family)